MTLAKKYHKIPNLYRTESQEIFNLEEVVVTEKIDGTNFSFGLVNGEPRMNSRNNQVWGVKKEALQPFHNVDFDGSGFVSAFMEEFGLNFFDLLREYDNLLIYGEFYGQGVQNRVNYGPEKKFTFFDAYDLNKRAWLSYNEFVELTRLLGLPTVPKLYIGPPKLSVFERLLNQDSKLGIDNGVAQSPNLQEGIVIKGLNGETNKWGERIITKYKQERFSEIRKTTKKKKEFSQEENSLVAHAEYVCEKYLTEGRLDNCLEKLRAQNVPVQITAMRKVISYLQEDVLSEMDQDDKIDPSFDERVFKKVSGKEISILFQNHLKKEFEERIR